MYPKISRWILVNTFVVVMLQNTKGVMVTNFTIIRPQHVNNDTHIDFTQEFLDALRTGANFLNITLEKLKEISSGQPDFPKLLPKCDSDESELSLEAELGNGTRAGAPLQDSLMGLVNVFTSLVSRALDHSADVMIGAVNVSEPISAITGGNTTGGSSIVYEMIKHANVSYVNNLV